MIRSTKNKLLKAGALSLAVLLVVTVTPSLAGRASSAEPYEPTWSSLDRHPAAPEWFQDAKFGVYWHWGAFTTPEYDSEWYPRHMYASGHRANKHHIDTYGDPAEWGYDKFIDGGVDKAGNHVQFAPKLTSQGGKFDPADWIKMVRDSGARFAGPVAEHHDGYSMWDSAVNEWNSVDRGPRLDLLKIFTDEIRKTDMKLLVALHHAYHYNGFYEHVPQQTDASKQKLYGQLPRAEMDQLWLDKLKEVVGQAKPDILWQDFSLDGVAEKQRLESLAHFYDSAADKQLVATYKLHDSGYTNRGQVQDYERGGPGGIRRPYWLTDDAISSSSWSYTQGIGYYSTNQMLHSLLDRVSKNGNMLLNISPTTEGTIPQAQRDVLKGIGDFLHRAGESVYSTRAWDVYGEGPTKMGGGSFTRPTAGTNKDIRFTRSKNNRVLYATVLGWPGEQLDIASLGSTKIDLRTLSKAELLGATASSYTSLTYSQDSSGLHVKMPAEAPVSSPAHVVKLTFSGAIPMLRNTGGAQVFTDVGYSNTDAPLAFGAYTANDLLQSNLSRDVISAVRPAPGYVLTGYDSDDLSGTSWRFTTGNPDLRPTGNNDRIRSLFVEPDPDTWFRVLNAVNGLALDSGGSVPSGTAMKVWSPDSSTNLQFRVTAAGGGYYKLLNRTNGLVVDGGGATKSGSSLSQTTDTGATTQQWSIRGAGNGTVKIINRATGLAIDGGGVVASGSPVKQWADNGSDNLKWRIATNS